MVRVKICGVTGVEDALLACELGADAIGLNFFPKSPRCVTPFVAQNIVHELPPFAAAVGVFVNWKPEAVIALAKALQLAGAQLHGDETPADVSEVAEKLQVIKALRPARGSKPADLNRYRDAAAFLVDAAGTGHYGGSGETADWEFAREAAKSHRVILAGGLTPANVGEAIRNVKPYAVDVASGVESKPGKKDAGKLREFFAEVARASRD
ncbi:MAG: phosphoribosylanthranilate isomerase [Candidatus Acidiferrum sp.]